MGTSRVEVVSAKDAAAANTALARDGVVILSDFASPEQVEAIRQEMAPHFEAASFGFEPYAGLKTRRIGLLMRRSPTLRGLMSHPTLLSMGAEFLGGENAFQIHSTMGIDIGPESDPQPLHHDDMYSFPWPERPRPEFVIVSLLAIDAFTAENGATRVIVGSHLWPQGREPGPEDEVVQAVMPSGSIVVMFGSTWHSGGANVSPANRIGARFTFSRSWVRQEENQYLVVPPSEAANLDPVTRGLLGYRVTALGAVLAPEFDNVLIYTPPAFILEALKAQEEGKGGEAAAHFPKAEKKPV